MRSPDDDSRRNYPKDFSEVVNAPIPNKQGAPTGTSGIKSPASPRQQGDIEDRVQALGGMKLINQ